MRLPICDEAIAHITDASGIVAWFRVYPGSEKHNGLFYIVRVFDSPKTRRAYCKRHWMNGCKGAGAAVHSVTFQREVDGHLQTSPWMGEIHLDRTRLGAGVISHEATHAAIFWMERTRRFANVAELDEVQELLCWTVGNVGAQIVNGLYRKRVYDDPVRND